MVNKVLEIAEIVSEPLRRLALIFETEVKPVLEALNTQAKIIEQQRKMFEQVIQRVKIPEFYLKPPVFYSRFMDLPNIVDGEIERDNERKEIAEQKTAGYVKSLTLPVPQTIQPYRLPIVREEYSKFGFGITLSIEGRFRYYRKLIRGLNSASKHGKFFLMLLTNPNNYLTDKVYKSKVLLADQEKGIYYVKDDLVEALRRNGVKIHFFRQRKTGYRLLKITKLPN